MPLTENAFYDVSYSVKISNRIALTQETLAFGSTIHLIEPCCVCVLLFVPPHIAVLLKPTIDRAEELTVAS